MTNNEKTPPFRTEQIGLTAQLLASADYREASVTYTFAQSLMGREVDAERALILGEMLSMLCKISSVSLLNRVYRFVKYIYIHRDVT